NRPLMAWLDNHNRYSEWEAEVYSQLRREAVDITTLFTIDPFWRRRILKRIWVRLPFRPLARFLLFYVLRRGFRDGRQGLWYAILMGYYEFLISIKARELTMVANRKSTPAETADHGAMDAPHAW